MIGFRYRKNIMLLIVLIFLSRCSAPFTEEKVYLHGEFPVMDSSSIQLTIKNEKKLQFLKVPLTNGKFDLYLDSLQEGVFNFCFQVFLKKRMIENTEINRPTNVSDKLIECAACREIYINPKQAKDYFFKPEKKLTAKNIKDYIEQGFLPPDQFRIQMTSKSMDSRLFESLDSLQVHDFKMKRYHIMDSLYRYSVLTQKSRNDFSDKSNSLSIERNYADYLKKRRNIVNSYMRSPIAVYDFLNIREEYLKENFAIYKELLSRATGRAKESNYYKLAKLKLAAIGDTLAIGKYFPLPEGRTLQETKLDFEPSKYRFTLVEFWASWCVPCRQKNPEWNEILDDYQDQKFSVLGVSLDVSEDRWRKAIQDDHLGKWFHVSSLDGGFSGSNALKYGIKSIPFNVLIDQNRQIVDMNIEAKNLKEFLHRNITSNAVTKN